MYCALRVAVHMPSDAAPGRRASSAQFVRVVFYLSVTSFLCCSSREIEFLFVFLFAFLFVLVFHRQL